MTITVSDEIIREIKGGSFVGKLPFDTIKLRMKEGQLQLEFENAGETMATVSPPENWELAEFVSIGGVNGVIELTVTK